MKIEIKEIRAESAFKVTLYMASIPIAFMMLVGIIMTIVGAVMSITQVLFIGIAYIAMPVFMLFIYGLFSLLMAVVYNACSKKFGGLEITIEEKKLDGIKTDENPNH